MATKKISELEAITVADENDVLVVVDVSEGTTNKITKGNLLAGAGHTIEIQLNPQTYQLEFKLKNEAGTVLSTQVLDLPSENAVTGIGYNNGSLTITKQSGATSEVDISPLIEGLVTESDFNTFKEALQTILEAINEKDTEQDEAIAENYKVINKLNEKLENQQKVIDQLPQVTGQGTEVTLENTIEAPFTKFDEEGNSTQETTEGRQLLKYPYAESSKTHNGITFTIHNDGSVTVNGTSTGTATLSLIIYNAEIENGNYTAKLTNGISGNVYLYIGGGNSGISGSGNVFKNIEVTNNTFGNFLIQIPNGKTFNNLTVYPMLVKGTYTEQTMPEFEKYTGGITSPNPNYEQPIKSAGDNENIIDINRTLGTPSNTGYDNTNKRTFDVTTLIKFLTANNYYNAGVQIDYSLIDNGIKITTKQAGYGIGFPVILGSAKTYTISANIDVIDNQMIRAIFYKEDGTYISNVTSSGTNKFLTFTTTDDTYFVVIMLTPKANVETTYSEIKLEQGNKASSYSPYGMGSINEKISNKNLCKITDFSKAVANVQIKAENNILSFNGTTNNTISANDAIWKNIKLEVKEKGVYTPSLEKSITGVAFGYYKENSSTLISPYSELEVGSYTLGIYVPANTAFNNFTTGVQIEKGSATSYVSHEEQDYPIFVQQPFRSNKDKTIRDCFVKKSDGWYERHKFEQVDLGTKDFRAVNNSEDSRTQGLFHTSISEIESNTNYSIVPNDILSNKYISGNAYKYLSPGRSPTDRTMSRYLKYIYIQNSDFSGYTNEQVKEAMAGTILQYPRETPLDLPCTPEQIQQLENKPSTYKDFTIIQSEDETEAYLEVSGIYDMNKLITRVEVIESEV